MWELFDGLVIESEETLDLSKSKVEVTFQFFSIFQFDVQDLGDLFAGPFAALLGTLFLLGFIFLGLLLENSEKIINTADDGGKLQINS